MSLYCALFWVKPLCNQIRTGYHMASDYSNFERSWSNTTYMIHKVATCDFMVLPCQHHHCQRNVNWKWYFYSTPQGSSLEVEILPGIVLEATGSERPVNGAPLLYFLSLQYTTPVLRAQDEWLWSPFHFSSPLTGAQYVMLLMDVLAWSSCKQKLKQTNKTPLPQAHIDYRQLFGKSPE